MDAHVFRHVSRILAAALVKARLERVHEPVQGIVAFSFFMSGKKRCLMFRAHRSAPVIFFTERSPFPNPAFPPAYIMRIRKYAEGRILGEARINWAERQMAFYLPPKEGVPEKWLVLDCRNGPCIRAALDPAFENEPAWPSMEDLTDPAPWERFPILTPHLRRTLEGMEQRDAAALLVDLEDGGGDLFWYGTGEAPTAVSAWPLPFSPQVWEKTTAADPQNVLPMLEAMWLPVLLKEANTAAKAPEQKQEKSARRKSKKLAEKLEEEKKRLESMRLLGEDARLLQANLWRFPPESRLEEISLPLDASDPDGEVKHIFLNSLLTVTENMELFFKKAAKASRGLAMLEKRMALLQEAPPISGNALPQPFPAENAPRKKKGSGNLFRSSLIQEFVSSDGFTMWRGRNAEGNRSALKLANPFDLWLHAEDGPSAHLIIRRDHAAREIPDRTLEEGAALVALKSWRKEEPKVPVMVALAKHVQPVKGAKAGTVNVLRHMRTVTAVTDSALEEKLRRPDGGPRA